MIRVPRVPRGLKENLVILENRVILVLQVLLEVQGRMEYLAALDLLGLKVILAILVKRVLRQIGFLIICMMTLKNLILVGLHRASSILEQEMHTVVIGVPTLRLPLQVAFLVWSMLMLK